MLKTYRMGAKLKKEVMKVLVNQMNEKDLARLNLIFKSIDIDNSGTITVKELHDALQ
jgi:calcium-dependent protein kinase